MSGLTDGELQELGAAVEAKLGVPAEQIKEFLDAIGITAEELARKLRVEVGRRWFN